MPCASIANAMRAASDRLAQWLAGSKSKSGTSSCCGSHVTRPAQVPVAPATIHHALVLLDGLAAAVAASLHRLPRLQLVAVQALSDGLACTTQGPIADTAMRSQATLANLPAALVTGAICCSLPGTARHRAPGGTLARVWPRTCPRNHPPLLVRSAAGGTWHRGTSCTRDSRPPSPPA